jgi:hypothetical protein
LATPAAHAQFTCITNADNTLTITGPSDLIGNILFPTNIEGLAVTSIGTNAFSRDYVQGAGPYLGLTGVTIPGSVSSIGADAFAFCYDLTNVTIGEGVTKIDEEAFLQCGGLTSVTIPDSATNIGRSAFEACNGITNVTIGSGVIGIGDEAFLGCDGLANATIGSGVTSIGNSAFYNSGLIRLAIPNSVTNIGDTAFQGCIRLTNVTIGNSVTSVEDGAFQNCTALTSVAIPDSVTSLGDSAFQGCTSLTNATIGSGVVSIGYEAFANCVLTSVTIPDSVTNIGVSPFEGCSNLAAITVNTGNAAYSSVAGVLFDKSQTTLVEYPAGKVDTSYTVPNRVTGIARSAFEGCATLSGVTIPNTVTSVGEDAFSSCSSLAGVYFEGNAPYAGGLDFMFGEGKRATVYCLPGTSGWINPYGAFLAVMLNPPNPAGFLQVFMSAAPGAVMAVAPQWYVDGGIPQWNGAIVVGLSVGTHTVSFSTVSGWTTPADQKVAVSANETATATGTYVLSSPQTGSLQVTITPSAAISAGAEWQVDAGIYRKSAATVTGLPAGSHTVSFKPTAGWNTPSSQTVIITNGATTKATGVYTQQAKGNPKLTVTSPRSGQSVGEAVLVVTGTVTDKVPVGGVYFRLNSGDWTLATTGNSWSNWTASVTLNPGANTISAYAQDAGGVFSPTNTVNLDYNRFLPEQGAFNGLFVDTTDVTEATSGFFTLALTTSGAFTGKIMTSGGTYSLPTTKFDAGGQVQFTVPTKQSTLTFNLQLDFSDPASEQITGTVSDAGWTAGLTADRGVFSATTNKAVNYEGLYTLAIAGSEDAATSPGGFDWAALSISPAGLITVAGSLADGTAISQSVSVSKDGRWPFYAAYAAPPAGNGGAVFGWLSFSNEPATALGGTVNWFRPAGRGPAFYQSGFTNLAVPVVGSVYNPAARPPLALTNGQVTLGGGNLPFAITNQVTLSSNGTITVAPPNTNKLALTINKTTGAISGSFANPSNPKQTVKINGVVLQNQTNAVGYFLGTNQSGAFLLEKP